MSKEFGPYHSQNITLATPYGEVIISEQGRSITYRLFSDLRHSEHNFYLFNYAQQIISSGVDRFNIDHLSLPNADKSIPLTRGKARLDMVYYRGMKIFEVELKTHTQLGVDHTRRQLIETTRYCKNLILVVPAYLRDEAEQLLQLLDLPAKIAIDTYPLVSEV